MTSDGKTPAWKMSLISDHSGSSSLCSSGTVRTCRDMIIDAALEAYLNGGDAEELLRAAALVLGSNIPLDEKLAETLADLTTAICEDYDDAGRAVRRWFALMGEPGARH